MRRGIHHLYTGVLKEIGVFHQLGTQNSEKRELASADSNSAGALILDFSASRTLCLPITLPKEFCYGNPDRQVTASDTCSRKHLTGFWQVVSPPSSTSSSAMVERKAVLSGMHSTF